MIYENSAKLYSNKKNIGHKYAQPQGVISEMWRMEKTSYRGMPLIDTIYF